MFANNIAFIYAAQPSTTFSEHIYKNFTEPYEQPILIKRTSQLLKSMLKLFTTLIEHFLFTLCFIVGVQIPEFINQYIQRLSGHLDEARFQLHQFQIIADNHFQGKLEIMIARYRENLEPSILQTADVIANTTERVANFESHLQKIQQGDYIERLYTFIIEYDVEMAYATLQQFKMAIPLDVFALATGAGFAITLLVIKIISTKCTKYLYKRSQKTNISEISA